MRDSAVDHEEMGSNTSNGNENGTTPDFRNVSRGGGDVGASLGMEISSMPPFSQHEVSHNGSSVDEMQEMASNASTSNDKRGYKLSHTVPAETWEKAIVAVEQQGMSLRAAAKLYGVHFAALHRRVKKRAQAVHAKGTNGYFHPSDEAGIMRVVVARAELGVLMTFDELMRLVEAAALRKLPDISMDSARKLLTRFQSRNEQSIRHIIEDWPPPRLAIDASSPVSDGQHRPYLGHPGFDFRTTPFLMGGTATAAAVAAATSKTYFVPPLRLAPNTINYRNEPRSPGVRLTDTMRAMGLETTKSV
ncbi:Homeodomain-like [Phytophthora cactorum]|nr:Homeodomain-like [Phytophthora cactorum]